MDPLVQAYANKLRDRDYENAVCIVEIAKLQKENEKLRKELEEFKEIKKAVEDDEKGTEE